MWIESKTDPARREDTAKMPRPLPPDASQDDSESGEYLAHIPDEFTPIPEGPIPDGIPAEGRMTQRDPADGGRLLDVDFCLVDARQWPCRPESRDGDWGSVRIGPLVLALRLTA